MFARTSILAVLAFGVLMAFPGMSAAQTYPPPPPPPPPPPGGGDDRVTPVLRTPVVAASQVRHRIIVRVTGRMGANAGLRCGGRIRIGTRAGGRGVRTVLGRMQRNCRYARLYSIPIRRIPARFRPRSRLLVLRVQVRYLGNSLLKRDLSPPKLGVLQR